MENKLSFRTKIEVGLAVILLVLIMFIGTTQVIANNQYIDNTTTNDEKPIHEEQLNNALHDNPGDEANTNCSVKDEKNTGNDDADIVQDEVRGNIVEDVYVSKLVVGVN